MSLAKTGACWLHEHEETGDDYFTGIVEVDGAKVRINIFLNEKKAKGKQPDYIAWLSGKKAAKSSQGLQKIGGLWQKESKDKDVYLGGFLEIAGLKINVCIFLNKKKEKEDHPDYIIWKVVKDQEYRRKKK